VPSKFLIRDGEEIKSYMPPTYSANLCQGGEAIASNNVQPGYSSRTKEKAFDGNDSTLWGGVVGSFPAVKDKAWIGYHFNESQMIKKVRLLQGSVDSSVTLVEVQASENGEEWVSIGYYEVQERNNVIDIEKNVSYPYWRLFARSHPGNTNWGWSVYEVEMYTIVDPGGWRSIGVLPISKEMFDEYGMDDLSLINHDALQELTSEEVEILCWTDEEQAAKRLNISAVPFPQLLLPVSDIEKEINAVNINSNASGSGVIKVILSSDGGSTWIGQNQSIIDIDNLMDVKSKGFTPEQINALTAEDWESIAGNGKIRFAFYLEQESLEDVAQINSVTINYKEFIMTPAIEDLSIFYNQIKIPVDFFVSRDDGATWKEAKVNEMTDLTDLPAGQRLKVKAVLANDQELYGISYSWI